jgi:hypothetical protein
MSLTFTPPTVEPPRKPLGVLSSLRAVRRNVLNVLPAIAYTQPIVTGSTGPARWHMVQGAEGMKQVFLDNAANYPKSEVMIRMLRPAVGASLFTSEGDARQISRSTKRAAAWLSRFSRSRCCPKQSTLSKS